MAEITYSFEYEDRQILFIVWKNLANGDTGNPLVIPGFTSQTIQFTGTFGSGGLIVMEGTLDSVSASPTYTPVERSGGGDLNASNEEFDSVRSNVYKLRPRVTSGDGTTSITVRLFMQKSF
jgi:hypothetical protein